MPEIARHMGIVLLKPGKELSYLLVAFLMAITTGTIPEFEAENGEIIPEYKGLLAYSDSLDHRVLQLGN